MNRRIELRPSLVLLGLILAVLPSRAGDASPARTSKSDGNVYGTLAAQRTDESKWTVLQTPAKQEFTPVSLQAEPAKETSVPFSLLSSPVGEPQEKWIVFWAPKQYLTGRDLVASRVDDPKHAEFSERFGTQTKALGQGIWSAYGAVKHVDEDGIITRENWYVIWDEKDQKVPLYLKIGSKDSGNYDSAIARSK